MLAPAALLPALLLALFAFAWGSFPGAASFPAGPLGQLALILLALGGVREWRDPLRLGAAGRLLLAALLATVMASLAASPVPRAGRLAVVLLPAFLLAVPALARAFAPARRDLAIAAWGLAVTAVALWGLAQQLASRSERAALPLGHHNLLAAFLVVTLPVAALGLRRPGVARWIAAAAVATGGVAVVATRSWLGLGVLALLALAAATALRRARRLAAGLALVALAALVPRAEAMLAGADSSAAGRAVYARGGLAGVAARPWLGWGPGATPWTLAEHLEPRPGVNPGGEAVGELHSLPLGLAYELGVPGALLAFGVAALFALRRARGLASATDRGLATAGLLGLAAGGAMGLGNAYLAVPAIPLALAAAAGAALAGGAEGPARTLRSDRFAGALFALAAIALLARPALAQGAYQRALGAPTRALAAASAERAVALDPGFPLYAARASWLPGRPAAERAAWALAAADRAVGVGALWLRAGTLALEAEDFAGAGRAFARATDLDPLAGVPPFLRFIASGGREIDCAARALAAEPRLAAAVQWRGAEAARRAAVERLARWPGLPEGFAAALASRTREEVPAGGEEVDLAVLLDSTPALAISLHQFRRPAWPADVARIRLSREAVRGLVGFGAAAARADAAASAFPRGRCAPGDR